MATLADPTVNGFVYWNHSSPNVLKTNNADLGPVLTGLDLHDDPWGTNREVMQR